MILKKYDELSITLGKCYGQNIIIKILHYFDISLKKCYYNNIILKKFYDNVTALIQTHLNVHAKKEA